VPVRAGDSLDDVCRVCKTVRGHTVIAADAEGGGRTLMAARAVGFESLPHPGIIGHNQATSHSIQYFSPYASLPHLPVVSDARPIIWTKFGQSKFTEIRQTHWIQPPVRHCKLLQTITVKNRFARTLSKSISNSFPFGLASSQWGQGGLITGSAKTEQPSLGVSLPFASVRHSLLMHTEKCSRDNGSHRGLLNPEIQNMDFLKRRGSHGRYHLHDS
jgi:hypothetical protein